MVLGNDIHVPPVDLRVRGQRQGQRVGGVGKGGADGLWACKAEELEDQRRVCRGAGHRRNREDVAQQQNGRLPDSPDALLLSHHQPRIGEGTEVLRVPESVCIANSQEDSGEVVAKQDGPIVAQGLTVSPLRVGRLSRNLPWQALRVERCKNVREQVGGLLDEAVCLLVGALSLAGLHAQHHAHASGRQGRSGQVLERLLEHLLVLSIVG
mmetsp:Transcript_150772/g.465257  ORF Transcript_150772/g.465257 Transcript_150772/m.465257 type:complete len:210 (+) Transcript_150772:1175-1804(+)